MLSTDNILSVDNGNTAQYVYDAMNHRVRVQSGQTNEFLFDPFGRQTSTWNTAFNGGVEASIYWDNPEIAFRGYAGHTFFQHEDWLGTTRIRTDAQGQVASTVQSLAFGDGLSQNTPMTGGNWDTKLFAGLDQDTDTYHAQFRQYSPTMGRWMSPDPYDGSMDFGNPQSFNRYAYVGNNPLSFTDPSGLRKAQSCDDTDTCPGGGGGLAILTGGYTYGASWNEFTTLYNVFNNWTTASGARTASFYDIPIPHDGLDLVNIGYSAGRTFGADGGEIDTPDLYDPLKQGCLVSAINARLSGSGIMVDSSQYQVQGGHAEFGLSAIGSAGILNAIGFTLYASFGQNNGYRDSTLFNAVHINGQRYNLGPITGSVTNAQAHVDFGNSKQGLLGFVTHSIVDVFIGTLLGGTSLDPTCH